MKTEYSSVVFPPGTSVRGRITRALSAREGVTLTRVTEDGRDDLVIGAPGREPWDVPWAQVRGALRAPLGKPKPVRKESGVKTLTEYAINDPEGFVAMCDRLRAAGVVKLGALVLGPKPREAEKREPADPLAAAQKKHDTMFAASSIRPPFAPPQASENGSPRAVVQRRERDEAANGEGRSPRS